MLTLGIVQISFSTVIWTLFIQGFVSNDKTSFRK